MFRRLLPILLLWAICGIADAGVYHDPDLSWRTIESTHFRIHYHNGEAALAQRFWPLAERIYRHDCALLNWYPQGKTDVVLSDESDLANGFTRVFPFKSIVLNVAAPDSVNGLEAYDDWMALVFRHEFLHIVHLDMAHGAPLELRHVFGRHPLLFPDLYQPRWVIEGLAVTAETNKRLGVGRGQSSYFNMLMRMESLAGLKPIRRVNQAIGSWPAGNVPYLYGVFFFKFVRDKYGEQAIKQMVYNYSTDLIPFRINSNAVSVFHKDLPTLWNEYAAWLKHKYAPQIARVKQAGLRVGENLTRSGYQAGPLHSLGKRIYYYAFSGEHHPVIKVIDGDAAPKTLVEVNQHTRFSINKKQGLLITQPEICRNARLYYDIYRADANGEHLRRLTHCGRYRFAVWDGQGEHILAVHDALGNNRLDLLDANANKLATLWQGKAGEQIGEMASSNQQAYIVATVWRPGTNWNLEKFDLHTRQWTLLTHDHVIETQPQFTPDGQAILYSADNGGIYNIYRYDLRSGHISKLSNVLGGAFYPAMAGDRLAYIGYSARGFDVYALPSATVVSTKTLTASTGSAQIPVVAAAPSADPSGKAVAATTFSVANKPPLKIAAAATAVKPLPSRPYSPWRSLGPTYWSPDFLLDDQHTQLGMMTSGNDVLYRHQYAVSWDYDFKNHASVGSLDYIYDGLWPILHFGVSRELSLYVDNNNNPIRARTNTDAVLQATVPFLSVDRDWFVDTALIKQTDHDIWSKGLPPLPNTKNDIVGLALRYDSAKTYPLSVSRSDGRDVRLIYEDSDLYGDSLNKGQVTVADWREFIPLGGEQVLGLRLVEGIGRHNPSPFKLGGIIHNNTILSVITNGEVEPLFNKRQYSLRGYSEGHAQLIGRNMRLFSVEYRFPIDRIERGWMVPPIGINQLHGTLFYDTGGVWNTGSGPDHYYSGVGFELDADLDILYNTRLRTSLGFAKGLDKTIGEDKVYFRIGSQF